MRPSRWRPAAVVACGTIIAALLPISGANAVAGFGDVPADAFYAAPVQWLDDEGITTGTSPGCFSPLRSVTRGEFATFVWRERGEPNGGSEPFSDVRNGDFFAEAVAWMASEGITTGTSPTTFHPLRSVTRGETATFLWRRAGSPTVSIEPGGTCQAPSSPPSTSPPSTSPPSSSPPTSSPGGGTGYFSTLGPGATLPSGASCASRVKSAPEIRPGNAVYNNTRGTSANDRDYPAQIYSRVDGNFTGTTDEIIQWAACKWGLDEDIARAQAAIESYWDMDAGGDLTSNQNECHPELRTNNGSDCPESIGLLQVRWLYHSEAFEDSNAIRSTAYNVDYAFANWRDCYEGYLTYLGGSYAAGDLWGCLGVWFSGGWYTTDGIVYMGWVRDYRDERIWEQPEFQN